MRAEEIALTGTYVRLEPLERGHAAALVAAATGSAELYRWSPVPQGKDAAERYIDTALSWRDAGTAVPFATVRVSDGVVVGSTRFWNIERWLWPKGHERYGREHPDACEIGYSWLGREALRTGANTEAKMMMLAHAFEVWGVLRAHRMAADFTPRDSVRYSIVAAEWPEVKARLRGLLH